MKIKKIHLRNIGPIINSTIESRFSEINEPIPIAIVGQNGTGKSLTLSVVLDAMTEARRASFTEIQEVSPTAYLKVSSKNYIRNTEIYSYASATLSTMHGEIIFNEVVAKSPINEFISQNPIPTILHELQQNDFMESGFYKKITLNDAQKKIIRESLFIYFPYFRYETSYWMNEAANIDFAKSDNYYGKSKLNPIRTNIINETKRWILNVLLDREFYEQKSATKIVGGELYRVLLGYEGPNTQLFNLVNEIISTMLKAKDPQIVSARIGISPKGSREITIIASKNGTTEEVITPDISQMSSGELMTLGLATEIIRAYELVKGAPPQNLSEVKGLVLIDEIDLHLHVSFQRSVLPAIIRKFKNIQFILTTHSPFFLLGMAESGEIDIYEMPTGSKIAVEEFNEFQSSYELFVRKNDRFKAQYEEIKNRMAIEALPLIITEGKTDWKHIKYALNNLKINGKYDLIDVEFFEYENQVEMGDIRLSQMCEHMAALPQKRKMLFIFDGDNPSILKKMSGPSNNFKYWGNNVYSLCLPTPEHRAEYKNITIEMYYSEELLRKTDPKSGKRLWFSNEIEIITKPTQGQKIYQAQTHPNNEDELLKKVFDSPADQIVNKEGIYVGLSKSAFAEIITRETYNITEIDLFAFYKLFNMIEEICTRNGDGLTL